VNAGYLAVLTALWRLTPSEDGQSWSIFFFGFTVLVLARGAFEWWWNRHRRGATANTDP
jgi:hypothetical protein